MHPAADQILGGEKPAFALLDGASIPGLQDQLYDLQPPFECLYEGELEPDMAEVAPYLVSLEADTPFTEWVFEKGWGKHWGIFAVSGAHLMELRQHFRKFNLVYSPEGAPLLFRYYDPRVLRTYLPTCNGGELAEFFGPVETYYAEGETKAEMLRFELSKGALAKSALAVKEN